MSELEAFPDREALSRAAAETFLRLAAGATRDFGVFTVALAGGNTPRRAYEIIGQTWRDAPGGPLDWNRVHLFWGDERHVPPDHPDSNYRMTNEALIRHVAIPPRNVHPVPTEHPDAGKVAEYYEEELRGFFQLGAGELPHFDLILLGMGADGHVASLFPETEALEIDDRLVAANWVEQLESWRITLTLPVLNFAGNRLVLVAGREKREMLKRVIEGPHTPPLLPAERLKPDSGTLLWLADREAASWATPTRS
jgi:6-phosphogluconolactonase